MGAGSVEPPGRVLHWTIGNSWAVREGDWKLVQGSPAEPFALYNLAEDPLEPGRIEGLFASHLGSAARRALDTRGCADFSLRLLPGRVEGLSSAAGWRLRVNLQRQRGEIAAGVRLLPQRIPSLEELNLPSNLVDLVASEKGLVLVSGPTDGSLTLNADGSLSYTVASATTSSTSSAPCPSITSSR